VTDVRIRLRFEGSHSLGPGKIQLLEEVQRCGSISGAARALGMAYRHAWVLLDAMNQCFEEPVVATSTGGREGGGASLTPLGEDVVRLYRALESRAQRAIAPDLAALEARTRRARPARRAPGRGRRVRGD